VPNRGSHLRRGRSSVGVCSASVVVLQEFLVLPLEVVLEDNAADLEIRMLVSEARFLLAERRVEIRIVVDLAWATNASVERLRGATVAPQRGRVEQIASLFGEGQTTFVPTKVDRLDETFVVEVAKSFVLGGKVLFGYDSERADGGQRTAFLALQLVHTVAIDNELAVLAAWQIEVENQRVAGIVIVSVALAVDSRADVAATPVVVLARIVPSSVRHGPSCAHSSRRLGCP
jgi:hypothetical protein